MTLKGSTSAFAFKLVGPGIDVELSIDQQAALRALGALQLPIDQPVSAQAASKTPPHSNAQPASRPALSLREFLDDRQAQRKPDQIATIASFICDHEGAPDFARDEIKERFASAREPLPANFPRDFTWTIKNGWIAEAHGKPGRFYLTAKGAHAVAARFSNDVKKTTAIKRGNKRRRVFDESADNFE